jgi:hypothetical protein
MSKASSILVLGKKRRVLNPFSMIWRIPGRGTDGFGLTSGSHAAARRRGRIIISQRAVA